MLAFAYLIFFLALSALLTWWRVTSYQRRFGLSAERHKLGRR